MTNRLFFLLIFSISTTLCFAQANKKFIDTGSVKNQFDYLITKSNRYQNYKVVQQSWLKKLKQNVSDTLAKNKINTANNFKTIANQRYVIDSLNQKIKNSSNNIDQLKKEKRSISFLGMLINKSTFKTFLFTVILILGLLLAFFVSKFKQSNFITQKTKLALKDLEEEYNTHRTKALEREQKAMRRLQDEINKHKTE
ncbi:MAG: tRNA (guanine-N1)-methyltransferase [Lutibacter sp.]